MEFAIALGFGGWALLIVGAVIFGVVAQFIGQTRTGFEWVVAGSSIFHTVNPPAAFEEMRRIAHDATAVRV